MSRIGKRPVAIPNGVTITVNGQEVKAKGSKGELSVSLAARVAVKHEDDEIVVTPREESNEARALWGLSRTLVQNIVTGVSSGYSQALEINGVGFRAQVQGKTLQLQLGYSHDIKYPIPPGIEIKSEKPTALTVSGIDKQKVGQVAAEIRAFRPPEPYKGKGVKYAEERISRKEGKKK
jgi:large subunit ribosomal protein L6